ncbi:MAG: hypothetical protein H6Q68_1848 [Firmicutes bacterium]|nr:hypothetical protein [Bacillota bacterium]
MSKITLILVNDIAEIERMNQIIEQFAENSGMGPKTVFDTNLVLEEILINIISYGYMDEETHEIHVEISYDQGVLILVVSDDGRPFDPLAHSTPEVDQPAEEREIGGLGIYFVRQLMDRVEYKWENGCNVLYMEKDYRLREGKSENL